MSLFFGVLAAATTGEESVPEGARDEHDDDDDPEGEVARKTKERSTALLSQRGIRDGGKRHRAGSLGAPGGALDFGGGWSARLTGGGRDRDGVSIAMVSPMDGALDGSRDGLGMTMCWGRGSVSVTADGAGGCVGSDPNPGGMKGDDDHLLRESLGRLPPYQIYIVQGGNNPTNPTAQIS